MKTTTKINVCPSRLGTLKTLLNPVTEPSILQNTTKHLSNNWIIAYWFSAFILLFGTAPGLAQGWDCWQKEGLSKPWSVNTNIGITSYFGDLSIYDQNIPKKISDESGNSFGIVFTKHINEAFGLSGQALYGHIQSYHSKYYFNTQLLEYNLHARLNFINLFSKKKTHKLGIVGYAGIGHLFFKTTTNVEDGFQTKEIIYQTNVPEFIYFLGGGVYYKTSDKFGFTVDLALKQFQNDRLDDYVHGDNFDYYSYLSFGFTYFFYDL